MQRILRGREVETLTGLSRSTLYAMMAEGSYICHGAQARFKYRYLLCGDFIQKFD
jgi:predicted DNA-binding transcriptional regulator AlpA